MIQPMMCAQCGHRHEWPKDFPNRTYAICDGCYPVWSGQTKALKQPRVVEDRSATNEAILGAILVAIIAIIAILSWCCG